ncbi:MAG: peptide deformylase [Immundisolibacterales bacterium]|nr:peptide deformylase [Immundisolibacterales bacterium]
MAIRKVARLGHPVLRAPCRELTRSEIRSHVARRLVDDMRETMAEYDGVGLAAPQVHESVRVAIIEFDPGDAERDLDAERTSFTVFNPRTTVLDPTPAGYWEGCLSVPGMRGFVERPRRVQVDYLDESAKPATVVAEGFLATVFQHELDHLDGVLYVDRLADPKLFAFNEEFNRYIAEGG